MRGLSYTVFLSLTVGCGPSYAYGYSKGLAAGGPKDKLFCELRLSPDGDEYIYCPRANAEALVIPLHPGVETVVVTEVRTETITEVRTETTTESAACEIIHAN